MDNNDMNILIKKAQEMIQKNQIPDELKQVINNMPSNKTLSNTNTYINSNTNTNVSSNKANLNNLNDSSNIDINKLMNLVSKINNQTSDDDMSRLLFALKPYLRNEKKEKIDEYIKLIKMGKIAQFINIFGGDK